MVKVIVNINALDVGKLEEIGRSGRASSTYSQDFMYCIRKAIEEFIKKYSE